MVHMTLILKLSMEHITTAHPLSITTVFRDTFCTVDSVVKDQKLEQQSSEANVEMPKGGKSSSGGSSNGGSRLNTFAIWKIGSTDGTGLFPRSLRIEDQTSARTVLLIYDACRGFSAGGLAGFSAGAANAFMKRQPLSVNRLAMHGAGGGAMLGAGVLAARLGWRMWTAEECEMGVGNCEWKRRTWRLLADQDRIETCLWGFGGAALFGLVGLAGNGMRWRGMLGSVAVGSVLGTGFGLCLEGHDSGKGEHERNENVEFLMQRGDR